MHPQLHKLVWSEGMYLAPQHFQAQARFFENSVQFLADSFWPCGFGFLGLEIDEAELIHGTFRLHHLRGAMPGRGGGRGQEPPSGRGIAFDLAKKEDLPPSRSIAPLFPADGRPLQLYLALPAHRIGQPRVAGDHEAGDRPFVRSTTAMADFNTGQDSRPVVTLKPNLRICVSDECGEGDIAMPLARIQRNGQGHFVPDPTWVPPCLRVSTSPRLRHLLDRLLEVLTEKSRELTARRLGGAASGLRGDPNELVEFWLLHSVNAAIPCLRMWKTGRSPHPMQLFRDLSSLGGALCTFVSGSDPTRLPDYDHLALADCFNALDEHIQSHLEVSLPTNCITIPLQPFEPSLDGVPGEAVLHVKGAMFHGGAVQDPRGFQGARWVLSIRSAAAETRLIQDIPRLMKVSARDLIVRLVAAAMPGVPLIYLPVPPPSVPVSPDEVCFSIDAKHKFFDAITHFSNVGVAVPVVFPDAEVRLHIVMEKAK